MFAGTPSTTAPFIMMSAGYSARWNAELTQETDMGLLFDIAILYQRVILISRTQTRVADFNCGRRAALLSILSK